MRNQQLDDFMVQQIISRLIMPFNQWEAYQYGIIDDKGKVLKQKNQLKTSKEKNSWTSIDVLCCNLKKILNSYPTTQMKMAQLNNIQNAKIPTVIGQPPTYPMSLLQNFFLLKEEFVVKDHGKFVTVDVHDREKNNPSVGAARIVKGTNNRAGGPHAEFVRVDKEYRGKGIANQMYDRVEKALGQKLVPSHTQSPEAQRMWKRRLQKEEAPANSAGGGGIAGIGVGTPQFAEPPMRKKTAHRLFKRWQFRNGTP
jgi:hypothetical protein